MCGLCLDTKKEIKKEDMSIRDIILAQKKVTETKFEYEQSLRDMRAYIIRWAISMDQKPK